MDYTVRLRHKLQKCIREMPLPQPTNQLIAIVTKDCNTTPTHITLSQYGDFVIISLYCFHLHRNLFIFRI